MEINVTFSQSPICTFLCSLWLKEATYGGGLTDGSSSSWGALVVWFTGAGKRAGPRGTQHVSVQSVQQRNEIGGRFGKRSLRISVSGLQWVDARTMKTRSCPQGALLGKTLCRRQSHAARRTDTKDRRNGSSGTRALREVSWGGDSGSPCRFAPRASLLPFPAAPPRMSPSLAAQRRWGPSPAHWLAPGEDLASVMESTQKTTLPPDCSRM